MSHRLSSANPGRRGGARPWWGRTAAAALAVALLPAAARAHVGEPLAPHDLPTAWELEPWVVIPLLLSAALYAAGVRRLWRHAGTGRGVRRTEVVLFALGWVTLALALVSPIHALGGVLFSAHMVQHELLVGLAAPLLVLGRPVVPAVWALRPAWRPVAGRAARVPAVRASWHWLSSPVPAFALHGAALWAWHAPRLYEATLTSELAHAAQHTSFIVTALLFWWAVLRGPARGNGRGLAVLLLFLTMIHTGLLGALLTFASSLWYPAYAATTPQWGLMPMEDQQLAGLIMWIPASVSYLVAALAHFAEWLKEPDADARRRAARLAVAEG